MIWLGEERGCLTDWVTQQWVIRTGRRISSAEHRWLMGPIGKPRRIGMDFFANYAAETGTKVELGNGLLREGFELKISAGHSTVMQAELQADIL